MKRFLVLLILAFVFQTATADIVCQQTYNGQDLLVRTQ